MAMLSSAGFSPATMDTDEDMSSEPDNDADDQQGPTCASCGAPTGPDGMYANPTASDSTDLMGSAAGLPLANAPSASGGMPEKPLTMGSEPHRKAHHKPHHGMPSKLVGPKTGSSEGAPLGGHNKGGNPKQPHKMLHDASSGDPEVDRLGLRAKNRIRNRAGRVGGY